MGKKKAIAPNPVVPSTSNMPTDPSDSTNPAPITGSFRLIESKSGVQPFPGRVNGVLTQNVESFVTSVDAVIVTKGLTSNEETIAEGLSHLAIGKGDITHYVRCGIITDCTSWVELKAALRRIYGTQKDLDTVLQLREIIKLQDRRGKTFIANTATINDYLSEFFTRLENSTWASGGVISFKELKLLLKLGICTASLPDALVNSFDKKFSTTSNEADVVEQILKHSPKVPNLDPSIMEEGVSHSEASSVVGAVSSEPKTVVKCHNCSKLGHYKTECRVRYCSIHKTKGHAYKDCKKRPGYNSKGHSNKDSQDKSAGSSSSENFQKDKKSQSKD